MKVVLAAIVLAMVAGTSGCSSQEDKYCKALSSDRKEFADMVGASSPTALVSHLPMLESLATKAPDDLSDEWQTFLTAIRALRDALADAGVKPSDYKDGNPPAGLSAEDRSAITQAADELTAEQTVEAASGIDQEARDVCKINLGM